MKLTIFSVYDSKAQAYIQPFFAQNDAVARRMFAKAANDANSDFHQFAGDYTLFELGEFDQTNGQISMLDKQINHNTALQYVAPEQMAPSTYNNEAQS